MLRARPTALFVFGDNIERRGNGGQAAQMHGEPNAIGIPTKWRPSMRDGAFFSDRDYPKVHAEVLPIFRLLSDHLAEGGDIVWPEDGIGTGRAELATRAPKLAALFEALRTALMLGTRL